MKFLNRKNVGYGLGYIGQGATYGFVTTYFIMFMTNCVGMYAAYASMIMSLSLIVEVFAGMILGHMSDHSRSKMGKRRPYILASAVIMPVIMILLFYRIQGSFGVTFIYYLILSIGFRVAFCSYEIPNSALGAEIAEDYNQRTRIRTFARIFSIIGNFIAYVVPLWILVIFRNDERMGWQVIGIVVGVVALTSWMTAFLLIKEKPKHSEKIKENVIKNIAKNYIQLFKLRPMQILICYKGACAIAFALYSAATLYYMKYSLQLDNQYTSYLYFFSIFIFAVSTPLTNWMALRMGKSRQQMSVLLPAGVISLLVFVFGRGTIVGSIIYVVVFSMVQTSFWQMSASIFYDVAEVDELVYNQRREGDIMSIVSVFGTIITAVMVQIFGIVLSATGFDASLTVQSDTTVLCLEIVFILVPAICFLIGGIVMKIFPINEKSFGSLLAAVELKRRGESIEPYKKELYKILMIK